MSRWLLPRPPSRMMATLILSFAPQTRVAAAAVAAPRKKRRVVGLVTVISFSRFIISARSPAGRGCSKGVPTNLLDERLRTIGSGTSQKGTALAPFRLLTRTIQGDSWLAQIQLRRGDSHPTAASNTLPHRA